MVDTSSSTTICIAPVVTTTGPAVDTRVTKLSAPKTTVSQSTTVAGSDRRVRFRRRAGHPDVEGHRFRRRAELDLGEAHQSTMGTSELWSAKATRTLSNASITSTLSQAPNYGNQLTIAAFKNATSIGKSTGASRSTGAPTVSLTTAAANSLVYGVGNDWTASKPRTVGAGQTLIAQTTDAVGDTYWVRARNAVTPTAGTVVIISDTALTSDMWNLVAVAI